MRSPLCRVMLAATGLIVTFAPVCGYEDLTHQALSKRAIQVAAGNATTLPPGLVGQFVDSHGNIQALGAQLINGAGVGPEGRGGPPESAVKTDGEDYTKYHLDWSDCKDHVKPKVSGVESLNHFESKALGCGPARTAFVRFYHDSVDLWKAGYWHEADEGIEP